MEAITEANRTDPIVKKFLFPSSVSAYGSDLPARRHRRLAPRSSYSSLRYSQDGIRPRGAAAPPGAPRLQRVHAPSPYFCRSQHAELPDGSLSRHPQRSRKAGRQACGLRASACPACFPTRQRYLENKIQFVHVDDMARLLAFIVHKTQPEAQRLTILNVAGRGQPLTFAECIEMAHAKLAPRARKMAAFRSGLSNCRGSSAFPPFRPKPSPT